MFTTTSLSDQVIFVKDWKTIFLISGAFPALLNINEIFFFLYFSAYLIYDLLINLYCVPKLMETKFVTFTILLFLNHA